MDFPILVLCIDRDNDLYEKAKFHGPIVGREENLKAATALALSDPEDPDANAIYYSIKIYDELKNEGKQVIIATITGNKKLGYHADIEISKQLDKIISETGVRSCIFVSDGVADEEVLPIVQSRIKVDSVKTVVIKQAKELEKTYFVILEKLKDPYYMRLFIGLPALLLFLLALSMQLGYGWQPIGIIVGLYLLIKGFGIEDYIINFIKDFKFTFEKPSWISYIAGIVLLAIAIISSYQAYFFSLSQGWSIEKIIAFSVNSFISIAPWAIILMLGGKVLDALGERRKFVITKYSIYAIATLLTTMVLKIGSDWILNLEPPYVYFEDFLLTIIIALLAGYVSLYVIKLIKEDILHKMKLEGKEIIEESGSYIGKIVGVNTREGYLIVLTPFERKTFVSIDNIRELGEKVVVKY